jgi:hypothetical protein
MAASRKGKIESTVLAQQAQSEREQAKVSEADFRHRQSRAMASRRAAMGASGVDPSTGSPLLVSEDFANEAELQAMRIRHGGEIRATRAEQEAALRREAGRSELTGSFFRSGSLLLSGAGRAFS